MFDQVRCSVRIHAVVDQFALIDLVSDHVYEAGRCSRWMYENETVYTCWVLESEPACDVGTGTFAKENCSGDVESIENDDQFVRHFVQRWIFSEVAKQKAGE